MPWTGSTFIRHNEDYSGASVWQSDAAASILIESVRHDYHDFDLANGIDACINKNGANTVASNISWGSFKIIDLGAGTDASDAATFGQTVTAAALDPTSNILSLTRATGGNVTVDLSSLVLGGSTAPFARLASSQTFTGVNIFGQNIEVATRVTINSTTTGDSWRLDSPSVQLLTVGANGGCAFNFFSDGSYGVAGGALTIGGYRVWDESRLTQATIDGLLSASSNETITGVWSFVNAGAMLLPATVTYGGGTNSWNVITPASVTPQIQIFSNFSSGLFKIDYDTTEGTRIYAGAARTWNNGNWRVIATAAPTGGVDNDVALVLSGANQGLWARVSGTWTKIIAGP